MFMNFGSFRENFISDGDRGSAGLHQERVPPPLRCGSRRLSAAKYIASYLSQERGFFQFLDPPRDVERLRAALVAVEDRMAPPKPVLVVDQVEPAGERIVARVEREPERLEERGGAQILLIIPERRAGPRAR